MDTLQDFIEKIRHLDSIGCTNLATWLIENASFRDGEIASATDRQLERAGLATVNRVLDSLRERV